MKPVLICLFLIGLSLAGSVSASGDTYEDDWFSWLIDANPYAGCPSCVFAYDTEGLLDPNPYAVCPVCVFAYDDDGLLDPNPLTGCPSCVFAYDDDGLLDPNPYAGCPTCSLIFDTGIEYDLNSPDSCPTCGTTQSSMKTGYSSLSISSNNAPGSTLYTFANGTPIPADYVCPIHGIYCPDDPRPTEDRPGYAEIVSYEKPAMVSRTLPETTAEFMNLFTTAVSIPKSGRLEGILYRSR